MGLFGKIIKTVIDVAGTPIDVVKDIATMGGALTDEDEPYTLQQLKKIGKDVEDIKEKLDE